jgi:hypothetical protein
VNRTGSALVLMGVLDSHNAVADPTPRTERQARRSMSSHREAPEISKDPVADSSDLYAFVSPDHPDTVTIIANYVPLQLPVGGPNFFEFGDDVLYELHIDCNGDARPDLTYQFRFRTELRNDRTFLYNTGPIESLDSANWNRRQFYSVTRVDASGKHTVLAGKLPCPPCNVGPLSIADYGALADDAVHRLGTGETVFAGQRADAFFVDLDAIFDGGTLRRFPAGRMNVHSIAVQLPLRAVRRDAPGAVIGVWTSASRRQVEVRDGGADAGEVYVGPHTQVSRLGNPLVNETIIPMAQKDRWNGLPPSEDKRFAEFVEHPELAALLPVRCPALFDNLAALNRAGRPRADLLAVLLTGIPAGLIDGFENSTGEVQADVLRLNTAVPPAPEPHRFGLLGADLAGFPNGRRITDDVVSIVVRAVAGATVPLVDPGFTPDAAVTRVEPGPGPGGTHAGAALLDRFPYLGLPFDGSAQS